MPGEVDPARRVRKRRAQSHDRKDAPSGSDWAGPAGRDRVRRWPWSSVMIAPVPIPIPDRVTAERFLNILAPGTERFTFQTFTDCREKREEYKAKGIRDPLARVLHGS